MKITTSFLLCIIAAGIMSCSKGKTDDNNPPGPPPPTLPNFTDADATSVFNSFNDIYYNPAKKLYFNATNHSGTGAIWTQAIFWDIAMHAYERTNKPEYLTLINDIYQGGFDEYAGYDWTNQVEWFIYDDMMWWIISLARAYEITGNQVYLDKSISGFDHVWDNGHDDVNGGMYWQFSHTSKHACINYPTVIAAMRLYNITGEQHYLDKAKEIYAWSRANLYDANRGRVADSRNASGGLGWEDYTYNQGTAIGAAVMLYKETNEVAYLNDATKIADYTKTVMCGTSGLLPAEGDWNEQGVLKAIFAQYIFMLIDDANQQQYLPWIQYNASWAWRNRDKTRNIMHRNYGSPCPTGIVQSYESSSGVAFLQLCPPVEP